jgi:FkbM family methyltransferase
LFLPSVYEGDAVIDRYLEWGQVKAGDTVLDIGAFAGDATYFFSKRVGGTGRVLAVEPDRLNAEALLRNVQDHHLANVQVASCAVWDTDGEALFDGDGTVGSGLVETLCRPTSEKIRVPTCTLATLLDRHGLDRVDCIKMDIEGAEVRVLRQCMERLRQLRPRLIIGPHELNDNNALGINARQASEGSTAYEVIRLLQEGGFSVQSVGGDIADANILATWP